MTAPDWLTVQRGSAPLLVSLPHTGTDLAALEPRLVSPWLARKDADWGIDRLYDFAADLGATVVRTSISRTIIDVNRDPSGASLYPIVTPSAPSSRGCSRANCLDSTLALTAARAPTRASAERLSSVSKPAKETLLSTAASRAAGSPVNMAIPPGAFTPCRWNSPVEYICANR